MILSFLRLYPGEDDKIGSVSSFFTSLVVPVPIVSIRIFIPKFLGSDREGVKTQLEEAVRCLTVSRGGGPALGSARGYQQHITPKETHGTGTPSGSPIW